MAIRKELSLRFVLAYDRADFARVLRHVEAGEIRVADFVTETIGLDDVEAAFHKMHKGEVLRSVVVF